MLDVAKTGGLSIVQLDFDNVAGAVDVGLGLRVAAGGLRLNLVT